MQNHWTLVALPALLIGTLLAQNAHTSTSLRDYSRQQLIACLNVPAKCHARDLYEVEDELDKRLPQMSTIDLVRCFADWKICGAGEDTASGWEISDELARRGHTDRLIAQYGYDKNRDIRDGIEHLAYKSPSRTAVAYMQTIFTRRIDDGENLYWPAMYLAKHCDLDALRYLDPGPDSKSIADNFSVSSAQFAETAGLFGKCRYRPAIPYLVVIGLHAASVNLIDASFQSLERLYPETPRFDFGSLSSGQQYFCAHANRDGFHLNCSDN